jgi:periplasmic protein TonB
MQGLTALPQWLRSLPDRLPDVPLDPDTRRRVEPWFYALLVALGLFWVMHLLVMGAAARPGTVDSFGAVDFIRLQKDPDLETRERRKPPKPEPPKQPPPPKMQIDTPPPQAPPVPFQMPKLSLPTQITGGPFLGSYVGDTSGYSELIPLVRIAPQYPRNAMRDRIEGEVVLEIVVNPDGTVRSARPISAQPRGVFESAAVAAALKWKFKPKIVDGKAVEHRGIQPMNFSLEN